MPLSRTRDYLSIGEVLEAVRSDYPDISISKIRFLEAEGLITPERTASGYRKFYESDVERLRYILSLQKDHFLPLKVIRERLTGNGAPSGRAPAPVPPPAAASKDAPAVPQAQEEVELDRAALASRSGLTARDLDGLMEYGVLADRGDGPYDSVDLGAAGAAAALMGYGIEPRHLKMFRHMADREMGLYEQLVAPALQRGDRESLRQASEVAKSLLAHSSLLRHSLMRERVDDIAP